MGGDCIQVGRIWRGGKGRGEGRGEGEVGIGCGCGMLKGRVI
jgi:hypothetical protein